MLADVGGVDAAGDAGGLDLGPGPDARQHQDVGRADGAGAEDDLLGGAGNGGGPVGGAVLDAGGAQAAGPAAVAAVPVEHDPGDLRPADDVEVGPDLRLALQEGVVGAGPLAVAVVVCSSETTPSGPPRSRLL